MKQHEAVLLAMKQAGGYATLGQLYQAAPKIPGCEWKTKTPFASIRRIVQTHSEFFKIRPGLWALTSEKSRLLRLFTDESVEPKEREYSHYFYQGLVAEIGNLQGFQTFIPSQDKNRPFAGRKLGDVATLTQLSEFTFAHVLRRALTIDVTWLNSRKYPDSFFEIEHSTDINNSLLKFSEFQDFRIKFYIVADKRRKAEFEDKLSLGAFAPIKPYVKFWDYDSVSEFHTKTCAAALVKQAMA
ncbi:MAG TPA: hypothetical protein VF784_16635 [Anaerolineales bacterium]